MKYIVKKIFTLLLGLFALSFLAFFAFTVIPGDPAALRLGVDATPEALAALRAELGLDQPLFLRYFSWLAGFLQGDFGVSYAHGDTVANLLRHRLFTTGALMLLSFCFTLIIALPLGLFTAGKQKGILHWFVTIISQALMAIPPIFLGLLFTIIFGFIFRLFSPGQFVYFHENPVAFWTYLFFPALAIAIPKAAMTIRLIRNAVAAELPKEYLRTAKSKGQHPGKILSSHVFPNIAAPLLTFLALSAIMILTDTFVIEQIFSIPGAGRLFITAIGTRDYPLVLTLVSMIGIFILGIHTFVDIIVKRIDPRIST